MIDLETFKANAEREGICKEYAERWNSCRSSKQLFDMALSVKAVDYLCDAIAKGFSVSPHFIHERFSNFINGKYIRDKEDYTSSLYCCFKGHLEATETIITCIRCNCTIHVPKFAVSEIYCTSKCNIEVSGEGQVVFVCYGNPEDVTITGKCGRMKRIQKKERDRNE